MLGHKINQTHEGSRKKHSGICKYKKRNDGMEITHKRTGEKKDLHIFVTTIRCNCHIRFHKQS